MTNYQCTTCARIYGERPKEDVCTAVGFGNVERCGGLLVEAPDVYPRTQLQELGAQMFRESIERSVPADKSERANYWTQPITSEDIAGIKEHVAEELAKIPDGRLFDAQGNLNNVTHEQVSRQLRATHETHGPNHHIQQAHAEVLKDLLDYNALDKARTKYINDLRAQLESRLYSVTSKEFDFPRWKDEYDMPEHYNDMIKPAIDLHADQPFTRPVPGHPKYRWMNSGEEADNAVCFARSHRDSNEWHLDDPEPEHVGPLDKAEPSSSGFDRGFDRNCFCFAVPIREGCLVDPKLEVEHPTPAKIVTTLPPGTPAEGHITAQVDRVTVDENGTVHVAMKPYEALTSEAAQRMQDRWAEHYPETAAWHTPTKKEWSAPTMTKIKSIADRWVAQLNWIKQFYEVIDILTELQCPPPIDCDPRKPAPATFGPYPTSAVGGAHLSWSHKGKQIAFVTQSSHPTKRSYGFRVGDRKWHSVTDPRQLRDACEEFVSDLNRYLAEIS